MLILMAGFCVDMVIMTIILGCFGVTPVHPGWWIVFLVTGLGWFIIGPKVLKRGYIS